MSVETDPDDDAGPYAGYAEPEERPPFAAYAAFATVFNGALAGAVVAAKRSGRDLPERVELQDLVLIGAASYKLSRLVAKKKITSFVRAPFTELQGKGGPAELEEKARGRGLRRAVGELLDLPVLPRAVGVGRLPRRPSVRAARHPLQRIRAHGDDDLGLPPDRLQGRRGLAASPRGRRTRSRCRAPW